MPSSHRPDQLILSAGSGASSRTLQPVLPSTTQPVGASTGGGAVWTAVWANAGPASTAITATNGTYICITGPRWRRRLAPHELQPRQRTIGSPGRAARLDPAVREVAGL